MRGASVTSTWESPSPDSADPALLFPTSAADRRVVTGTEAPSLLCWLGTPSPRGCGLVMATDQKRQKLRTLSPLRFLCWSPRASRHTPSCTARPSGLVKAIPSRRGYLEQRPEATDHAWYVFFQTLWPQMLLRRCFFSPGPGGREMLMMFQMVLVPGSGRQPGRTVCPSEGRPGGAELQSRHNCASPDA